MQQLEINIKQLEEENQQRSWQVNNVLLYRKEIVKRFILIKKKQTNWKLAFFTQLNHILFPCKWSEEQRLDKLIECYGVGLSNSSAPDRFQTQKVLKCLIQNLKDGLVVKQNTSYTLRVSKDNRKMTNKVCKKQSTNLQTKF